MLTLHTAGDLRVLADGLGEVLSVAPADPMRSDWVAVPSAGMRTWLSLHLARRLGTSARAEGGGSLATDGVSANIAFPFPGSLRFRIIEAGNLADGIDHPDPWMVERLVWAILEVAADAVVTGSPSGLPAGLVDPPLGVSRYGAARQVADLFDRYHLHRPAMVQAWAAGRDVDGVGGPLPGHHLWQARLWRAVREHVGGVSPPERMGELLARLRAGELDVDLPERVSVFGTSLLPGGPGFVELAAAVGVHREVHLFVIQPSPVLAQRFAATVGASTDGASTVNRSGHRLRKEVDATVALHHPLLRSWGRLHYETASVLIDARASGVLPTAEDSADAAGVADHNAVGAVGVSDQDAPHPVTLLARLRADIRADRPPAPDFVALDDSIEFHACHGPSRQVEVLRDVLLRLLHDHPHLQEDDVLVVCPELETMAPLIEATFGATAHTGQAEPSASSPPETGADLSPPPRTPALRYRLADRSLGASVPLVGAFTTLLDLVAGRFDAPGVLDFLTLEPVCHRFGFGEDDVATVTQWVLDTNVRWGLDPEDRVAHGVPASITTNTWRAGLDRVLLGSAVLGSSVLGSSFPGYAGSGELTDSLGGVIPHDTEGSDVAIAGRLGEVLWRLGELADDVARPRDVEAWIDRLKEVATEFFSRPRDQAWQLDRLMRTLGDAAESATRHHDIGGTTVSPAVLTFDDVRRLLAERLGGVEGRPSFFRGGITISSLTPLRWVPHKVIVMLGMDSPALTVAAIEGDDLAALNPLVGDRDRRGELRQSMLETVLSAQEHLIVLRDGSDVRTNQHIPMAVAVVELRDAVAAMIVPEHGVGVESGLETVHPRQAFDESYFAPAAGITSGSPGVPRSFDVAAASAARARRSRADSVSDFLEEPLDLPELEAVSLDDLRRFVKNPIRHFVERRLDLRLPRDADAPSGVLAVSLDGLDTWELGDRLLSLLSAADDPEAAIDAWCDFERRTGSVPPGRLGDLVLLQVRLQVAELHQGAVEAGALPAGILPNHQVDRYMSDGTRLVGTVPLRLGASDAGDPRGGPALIRFVKRRPEHLLSMWIDLAALTVSAPEGDWRGLVATRAESGSRTLQGVKVGRIDVSQHELDPADQLGAARRALETLVDLYRRGLREPLPLFRKVSAALHESPRTLPDWPDSYADDAEMLVFGHLSATDLCELPLAPHDPGGPATDRVRRYAHVLYDALDATLVEVER